jgi:site-specific recombinase XerD
VARRATTGAGGPTNAGRRFPAEVLDPHEVLALLAGCDGERPSGLRNRALIALLYRAGLRVSEALSLLPKDMDAGAGSVRVLCGKGGHARTVGIDPGGLAIVEAWRTRRAEMGFTAREPLLCTMRGTRMTASYVRVLLPRLAAKAGIEKRVHAHGLRHAHAAELRAEGVDIAVISRQLGHRSLLTTIEYLDHLAPGSVLRSIAARHWHRDSEAH